MKIDVQLDPDFVATLEELKHGYGEELAELNGFSSKQLDHTCFIDNFIDNSTVADASIDPSSNVGRQDMPTLMGELTKSHKKLLCYNKLFYEMKKKYGFTIAYNWLNADYKGFLYLHDAASASYVHYCYRGTQQLYVKYKNQTLSTTFEQLYELVDAEEIIDYTINYPVKFTEDLYVLDYNLNIDSKIWTKVTRLCKHNNEFNMQFIKLSNGLTQIVTSNHPMITQHGEKSAEDIVEGDKLFTVNSDITIFDGSINQITVDDSYYGKHSSHAMKNRGIGTFKLTKELGWLTGMLLSDASFQSSSVTYGQQQSSNTFKHVVQILDANNFDYVIAPELGRDFAEIRIKINPYIKWLSTTQLYTTSLNRRLPDEYIHYNYEFLDGFIAGMIDGDGSVNGEFGRQADIFSISETLVRQCELYLRYRGVFSPQVRPELRVKSTDTIKQVHPLYRTQFSVGDNEDYLLSIGSIKINNKYVPRKRKKGNFKEKKYVYEYGWSSVIQNKKLDTDELVYDITTESGHFLSNNILSHNCFAYDLKDLAERGLYFLDNGNFNAQPPQHLETFIDFVKEFISFACNRSSGAVGMPNLIPYLFYFWKKDCENGYCIHDETYFAKQQIQRLIYALNQPYTRDGIQSAFTNTSIFDHEYFEAIFGGSEFPDGTFMIDYEEEIVEFQKLFMEVMSDIRANNMMTFPVNSISLLYKDGKFIDEEFARWAIEHNRKWSDSNLFVDSEVTSLSNCCRLKSDVKELGYFNSIGSSALKVGSCKVSTINLARIALESNSTEEFEDKLKYYVELDCKILDVVRQVISRNVEKGLLQNFTHGLVDFEHLYNTIGFIGVYETLKHFGCTTEDEFGNVSYTKDGEDLGESIFSIIHDTSKQFLSDNNYTYMINCEQSPAENAADKLMKKDKFFHPLSVVDDLPLYGNQFMPLGIKSTLQERVRVQALFDSFCNGGSILHANIDAPFDSFDKAWNLTNYIASQGVTYFAFNPRIQACENNHGFYGNKCPTCGGDVKTEFTRVVGFFTPVNTWAKARKDEYDLRQWEDINE